MVVIILAAGYATRLYPYTLNTPKPLLEVGGKPIIDYIVAQVDKLPYVREIAIVTNNRFYEQFVIWNLSKNNTKIKIINDGTNSVEERLGAIGDIRFAIKKEKIKKDLIVIAGDNLFTYELKDQFNYFKTIDRDCICVKEINNKNTLKSLGVCELDENNKVIGFEEKPELPKSNIGVYATYMFKESSLKYFDLFLNEKGNKDAPGYFIEWLHKQTDVYAYFMDGECYDIGTVETYERMREGFGGV